MHQPIVSRSRLVSDLAALGVGDWPVVMVHTRMSAIGRLVGGAQTVVNALLDVLGPAGTLLVLTGWEDRPPYHQNAWDRQQRDVYMAECPPFVPGVSAAGRDVGRVPETVRTWPNARHSAHPVGSFAAVGADAEWLVSGQSLDEGYGTGSPLARMAQREGAVLLLGAPLETVTLLHYAEYLASGGPKRWVEYEMPVVIDGERVWRRTRELDSSMGGFPYERLDLPEDAFETITREALSTGLGRSGTVGQAEAHLLPATDLVEFGVAWLDRHFPKQQGQASPSGE